MIRHDDAFRSRIWQDEPDEPEPEAESPLAGSSSPSPAPSPAKVWPRKEPNPKDVARLKKMLSKWGWVETGRSILVTIDNRSEHSLRLFSPKAHSGTFLVGFEPPDVIQPNEMIVFGCVYSYRLLTNN